MSIRIIPPLLSQILPNTIILLRDPHHPHIHIHHQHTLLIPHSTHRPHNGQTYPRQTQESITLVFLSPRHIGEDNPTGILEATRRERRFKE